MTWSRCSPLPPLPVSVMNNVWGSERWDGWVGRVTAMGGEGVASGQGRRQPAGPGT